MDEQVSVFRGRLVLIRLVLTGIPVFWLSLVPIPVSILDKLIKVIFSYLWGTTSNYKKFHLADWQLLAHPTSLGGCEIKHFPSFSLSLIMKCFWLVINSDGIWNHLISAKYLKNRPLSSWLREKNFKN